MPASVPVRRWRRRLAAGSIVAAALAAFAVRHFWLLLPPLPSQDACSFGTAGDGTYAAHVARAEALAEEDRAELVRRFQAFDEAGVASLLWSQFDRVAAQAVSLPERVAALHAVMRANGAEYRRPYPDTADPFTTATTDGLGSVQFWYRININRFGVFEPLQPFSLLRADLMLVDAPAEHAGDMARPAGEFDFAAILMSQEDSGLPQPPSDIDPYCPPVPAPDFVAGPADRSTLAGIETRIFLEDKPALIVAGHSYLVRRDVIRDATRAIVNAYNPVARTDGRRADQVIRANPDGVTGLLRVFVGRLVDSREHLATTTPDTRHSTDVTDAILAAGRYATADEAWAAMSAFAADVSEAYEYETAGFVSTANSNAIVQSTLSVVGVDARALPNIAEARYLLGFPGVETVLASRGPSATVPVDAGTTAFHVAGLHVRGRDGLDDRLSGTPFADDFHGEQNAPDRATTDTVTYAASPAGVAISTTAGSSLLGGFVIRGRGAGGDAEGDRYFGIENFVGSPFADVFRLAGDLDSTIDAGPGDDELDGGAGNDRLMGGPGDDLYRFGPGAGADVIVEAAPDGPRGDRLVFDGGIRARDVTFVRAADDLVVSLPGGASVTIIGQFDARATSRIEAFVFAGSEMQAAEVSAAAAASSPL